MNVPFLSLKDITEKYKSELDDAVSRVVSSGLYLQGNENLTFEKNYSDYIGTRFCIGVANGLQALKLMFQAYKIKYNWNDGDEIIVPANTYIATILAISQNNLKPVLVEPKFDTLEIDDSLISKNISSKTKAVMIVHLYGRNSCSEKLLDICKDNGLFLFEDNAQAHGCLFNGKRTGSIGNCAAHSFYPGKNLGAFGDAGAVTTDDEEIAFLVKTLGNYGSSKKYVFDFIGENSRLDEINAAVLSVKLKYLDEDNRRRVEIAERYYSELKNKKITLPNKTNDFENVYHLFPVFSSERDRLQEYLKENGIQTIIHYPIPPHKQKAYKEWNDLSLPVTEKIHAQELSLPISPTLADEQVDYVINIVNNYR